MEQKTPGMCDELWSRLTTRLRATAQDGEVITGPAHMPAVCVLAVAEAPVHRRLTHHWAGVLLATPVAAVTKNVWRKELAAVCRMQGPRSAVASARLGHR